LRACSGAWRAALVTAKSVDGSPSTAFRVVAGSGGPTARLLPADALLEALVVHVKVAHGFLLGTRGWPLEFLLEGLIIHFQFVLHLLLLTHQIFHRECAEMLALDLLVIEVELSTSCLILQLGFDHEPV